PFTTRSRRLSRILSFPTRRSSDLSLCAEDDVELVAVVVTLSVVTDTGAVREGELLTCLLADGQTANAQGTVASGELLRVGVGLDGAAKLLARGQLEVLDVVGVDSVWLCAGRSLGDGGQTVPRGRRAVLLRIRVVHVQRAAVDTGLVQTVARLVPLDEGHNISS